MKKVLMFILAIMFSVSSFAYTLQGSTKNYPKKLIEVENLVNEEGKPTKLYDFKGKVVILYFGFSNCKHVCPTVNAALKQVAGKLNEKGLKEKYQIVFITVDPKRDDPKTLKKYKKTRGLDEFTFLTGKPEDLKKAWDDYGIEVKEVEKATDEHAMHEHMHMHGGQGKMKMITHTPVKTIIIDKNGNMVEEYLGIYLPVDKIVEDVEYLIKQ